MATTEEKGLNLFAVRRGDGTIAAEGFATREAAKAARDELQARSTTTGLVPREYFVMLGRDHKNYTFTD